MAFNRRVQRTLNALAGINNNYNTPTPKEDFADDNDLFQHIYDRSKKGAKGTWKGADWDTFENMLKADGITPADNMPIKTETSYNWQGDRPVSVKQRYIHVIVGKTDNGADDLRELIFKGLQEIKNFPQTYGELKEQMEYGAFQPAPEKQKDGSYRTFEWKQAVRFKTEQLASIDANSAIDAE